MVGPHPAQQLQAVDLRQLEVEQHDGGAVAQVAAGVGTGAKQVVQRL